MKLFSSALALLVPVVAACGSTDNTIFEPSRDSRISSLASAACSHYGDKSSGCPGYGTGANQKYATSGDCERDFQQQAAKLWPDDRCNNGQINSSAYDVCEGKAKVFACSTGAASFFDAIAALDECKADKVCIDPRQ